MNFCMFKTSREDIFTLEKGLGKDEAYTSEIAVCNENQLPYEHLF